MSPNKSKSYILPLFSKILGIKYSEYIINTYCFRDDMPEEDCFVIIYKKVDEIEFNNFIDNLISSTKEDDILISYDDAEDITITLKIPESIKHEYDCFINGKFSHFRDDRKKSIISSLMSSYGIKNSNNMNIIVKIRGILYREEILRKQLEDELDMKIDQQWELSSIPNTDSETFFINSLE